MLDYDYQFYTEKIQKIVGIDEAGRGPLAGPVVAAAVILPKDYTNEKINDSKKLSEKVREKLFLEIKEIALAVGVGIIEATVIDQVNIYEATKLAMLEALKQIKINYDLVLTDAMPLKLENNIKLMDVIFFR